MKTKKTRIGMLLYFFIFISLNAFSQWRYPNAKDLKDDVIITYEVKYHRELTEVEKKSPKFKREIVVIFNKNKLFEKTFSNNVNIENSYLFDYANEISYQCLRFNTKKQAISTKFRNPIKETILKTGTKKTILDLPCQVSTTKINGETREIYTTKKFGLKYVKQYKTEGFLMKYVASDKSFGPYTVTAKKISYTKLDPSIYSLKEYTVKSRAEYKEYSKKRKKSSNLAKEKAIKKLGELAPKYSARSIEGKKLKSKNLIGKIVVLNFWFTTCPPCKAEIPQLNKLKEKFKGENVEFIAIALDPEYRISKFLNQYPFTYDIVEDGRWIADRFEIMSYPSNIIIDKKGVIQFYKIGFKPDINEMMSYEIEKLLKK